MKNKILFGSILSMLIVSAVLFTGFKYQENKLFYYAFNEKIFLETVPNKFVVRYSNGDAAKRGLPGLQKQGIDKNIDYKDDRTVIIDLVKSDASVVLRDLQSRADVVSYQPLYTTIQDKLEIAATDEILVQFNRNTSSASVDSIIKKFNLTLVQRGEIFFTFGVAKGANTLQVANALMESGLAVFSHPNFYRKIDASQVPNDEYFNFQWNLHNTGQVINDGHTGTPNADINAPEAWAITQGSSSIVVAVIDEGVTSNHPDLPNARQVRLNGSNFSSAVPGNDPSPVGGSGNGNHGNACSGIIAATRDNAQGIAGIAPNCKIMPIKILNPSASDANVANAITFAKNNGAQVISNSWAYSGSTNPNLVPAIVSAISSAVTTGRGGLGCVVVFAASNTANQLAGNAGVVSFPSNVNIPGVLTVGASDRYDLQANYSPTSVPASANNQMIDIVAPSHRQYKTATNGESFEIWSMDIPGATGYNPEAGGANLPAAGTNFQSYTGRMGGTSAACPQVAAAAALLLSLNANLTQQQVFDILTQNADKAGGYAYNASGFSNQFGFGRLNLYRAVLKARADLYVRDQATDTGLEPNPDNTSPYYTSPDIWVRNANDGLTTHQNPEAGQTNYVYVKVSNRGYVPSSGAANKINAYWAKASTGLSWPFPWTGATYNCSGTPLSIGGLIGTQTISATSAGGFTTYVFSWVPPKPADYAPCFGGDASHFCLLARIETSPAAPFGMAFAETTNLGQNVKNNNNIAWKNISIVNLLPDMSISYTSVLLAGSKFLRMNFTKTDIRFVIPADRQTTPLLKAANIDIDLGEFARPWLEAGGRVEGGKVFKDDKGKILIRVSEVNGAIYGIPINTAQIGSVTLAITPVQYVEGNAYSFDLQQLDGKTLIGGERFEIQFAKPRQAFAKAPAAPAVSEKVSSAVQLKAYQSGKQLVVQMDDGKEYNVSIINSTGQVMNNMKMTRQVSIPVGAYQGGIYYVRIISTKDHKSYSIGTLIK